MLLSGFVQWIRDEHQVIQIVSTRAGGWEGWAAPQFAYWLGAKVGRPADLDVQSEVTANGDVFIFEDPKMKADLEFNALSAPQEGLPPVIVVELKCQRTRQTRSSFRAGLLKDLIKLEEISDDLLERYEDRGVIGLSLGVCFPAVPAAPGYNIVPATNELAVQWQGVTYGDEPAAFAS
jgi:hypothetical protein